jgi:galactokinase
MRTFRAPGRVNLIGEHTDYSGGFVLPAAIHLATDVTLVPRDDRQLVIHSDALRETVRLDLDQPPRPRRDWSDYVAGVVSVLRDHGCPIGGAELTIRSTIPRGAGLSSSAALEVATASALLAEAGQRVDRLAMARWCQRAENEFVGARCGIMDQYVACFGEPGHALLLDCRALDSTRFPIPSHVAIVILNTMVKHSIAAGEYNARREDCEAATAMLTSVLPRIRSLRDVTMDDLLTHGHNLPETTLRRARHVVNENSRTERAAEALRQGDLALVGRLMADSHNSLRDDYAVSCPELDLMVDLASSDPDVIGARMTGGGFGGCTVSLVERAGAERFVASMQQRYHAATGTRPDAWITVASGGVAEIAS